MNTHSNPTALHSFGFLLPAFALLGAANTDLGEDGSWPQWRGPDRDGISKETAWVSEGKEESLWSMDVGLGYSSVSIKDGRLYTMGHDVEAGLDVIWCLDARTGEELWAHPYPSAIWNQAHKGGTLNTPSIDGGVVFTLNREGNAFCFDAVSGEVLWHKDLKEEHDVKYPTWGFSASPLVLENELLVNCGKVLSLDKKTGELLWESRDYGDAYSTPTAFRHGSMSALAVLNGDGLGIIERKRGQELFFREWTGGRGVNGATPILIDDAVFISSGRKGGAALLALGEEDLDVVWENKSMRNSFSGCVVLDDHLYGFDQAVLKCIGVDGEEKWEARGIGNGALMATPDRLILMSAKGELIVAEATPEEYRELSNVKLFDAGSFWTKPVLVDGLIYCRTSEGTLVCRDHRGEE